MDTHRPHILIVDDTPSSIKILAEMLREDYELSVATSGPQALELARAQPPDVVLLDVLMPGMDGYEVCRRLKAEPATSQALVIFITVMAAEQDEAKGLGLGAVDYVTKPFNPGLVRARVRNHLELKRHRDHLEDMVRERTRDLEAVNARLGEEIAEHVKTQEELMRAKEAAEAANRAKSDFLGNMSHEIRTPLNGVMGMLQVMETAELSAEQRGCLAMAFKSCNRLTQLLSDILDLSRMEGGRTRVERKSMKLGDILEGIGDLYLPVAMESGVSLRRRLDPALDEPVLGDPARLRQVLANLVGNALKFTSAGEVSVDVSALPAPGAGRRRALFTVTDTGIGIPENEVEKLFEPFSQVSEGFTKRYQGAGLGLTISKRLVELMGGGIALLSEPGRGTTVCFSLAFGLAAPHMDREERRT